ncbi:hypothetical protein SSX86_018725 [Deinandra increscens subsp. villosa]|uniref:Uncharacterized protein n=1 Tax=Deinandra increscens subsp. villosa TaxID=3103831 RepID=A0AAP0GSE2_9ASTR
MGDKPKSPPPTRPDYKPIHPALTISNIKTLIPITLDMNNDEYNLWSEVFQVHCKAYDVLDHILPSEAAGSSTEKTPEDQALWERLDNIVLQWIFGTITRDLLKTIMKNGRSAADAWSTLKKLFLDNQNQRAVYLQNKFANTRIDDFPDCAAYCQALKTLSDQLNDVGAKVDDHMLVLQLIAGLNEKYDGVAMLLQQSSPLPDFFSARSKLILEETRKKHQQPPSAAAFAASAGPAGGLAAAPAGGTNLGQPQPQMEQPQMRNNSGRHFFDNFNRGGGRQFNNRGGRGRGGNNNNNNNYRGRPRNNRGGYNNSYATPWNAQSFGPWSYNNNFQAPPCPYPTMQMQPRPAPQFRAPNSAGILGPAPQAYAMDGTHMPTYMPQGPNYTMTLNPDQQQWVLDTGATHHMSNNSGIISTYVNNGKQNHIVVGNGRHIPISGTGNTTLKPPFPPLKINNILVAPHLIKNLLSVRQLTTDNKISIEFDPFGFLVKDYLTQIPILRCDSSGDLYPLSTPSSRLTSPATFAALSQDLWHSRLGHPGSSILRVLNSRKLIDVGSFSDTESLHHQVMSHLFAEFAMKDLGPLSYFLGVSVKRDSYGMYLSQRSYAADILARAHMTDCNPVQTPVDTNGKLSASDGDLLDDPTTYRSLAGALQYLTFTRPDISYAVQQTVVSRSSAEAEYRGVAHVVAEVCWLRNLLLELGTPPRRTSLVYCDNVSAIYMSGNPIQHQRTKHIEIDIHFVRDQVRQGNIRVLHVPSRDTIRDFQPSSFLDRVIRDYHLMHIIALSQRSDLGEFKDEINGEELEQHTDLNVLITQSSDELKDEINREELKQHTDLDVLIDIYNTKYAGSLPLLMTRSDILLEYFDKEEGGQFVNLHKQYTNYIHGTFGEENLSYADYLEGFPKLKSTKPSVGRYKTRNYKAYIVSLLDYLTDFYRRVNPLCIDVDAQLEQMTKKFETEWCGAGLDGRRKQLQLDDYNTPDELVAVGPHLLKMALRTHGLKEGGTTQQRAERLYRAKRKMSLSKDFATKSNYKDISTYKIDETEVFLSSSEVKYWMNHELI